MAKLSLALPPPPATGQETENIWEEKRGMGREKKQARKELHSPWYSACTQSWVLLLQAGVSWSFPLLSSSLFGPAWVIHHVDPLLAIPDLVPTAQSNCPPLHLSFWMLLPGGLVTVLHQFKSHSLPDHHSPPAQGLPTLPATGANCSFDHKEYHRTQEAGCIHPSRTHFDRFSALV